jgi:hypothetical protein
MKERRKGGRNIILLVNACIIEANPLCCCSNWLRSVFVCLFVIQQLTTALNSTL